MYSLHILVDSTTRRSSENNKYGESTACWFAFKNKIAGKPFRVGFVYNEYDGPNKIFYEGIIQALEFCFSVFMEKGTVWVRGDDQLVINQLKGERGVYELIDYHIRVKKLEVKYEERKKGIIRYKYINEENEIYKKVDRCAKQFDNFLKQRIC